MDAYPAKDRKPTRITTPLRFSPPWNESAALASAENRRTGRRAQPAAIRLAHWINIPLLAIMAGSGLQILSAYPALGPRGALYKVYTFQTDGPPSGLGLGGCLAWG